MFVRSKVKISYFKVCVDLHRAPVLRIATIMFTIAISLDFNSKSCRAVQKQVCFLETLQVKIPGFYSDRWNGFLALQIFHLLLIQIMATSWCAEAGCFCKFCSLPCGDVDISIRTCFLGTTESYQTGDEITLTNRARIFCCCSASLK